MTIFEAYEPTAHLIGSMRMISTNGMVDAIANDGDDDDFEVEDESDMDNEKSEDDELANEIKRVSHKFSSKMIHRMVSGRI